MDIKSRLIEILRSAPAPLSPDELVPLVKQACPEARSVDIKIETLCLVSDGRAKLNDLWQLSAPKAGQAAL